MKAKRVTEYQKLTEYQVVKLWSGETIKQINKHQIWDENGNLEEQYYDNGELVSTLIVQFNELELITKETSLDRSSRVMDEVLYEFDGESLMRVTELCEQNIASVTDYKYNDEKEILEETRTTGYGLIEQKYTLDTDSLSSVQQSFNLDGELIEEITTFYNDKKESIKVISKDIEYGIEEITINTYDIASNLIKAIVISQGKTVMEEEYAYNKLGLQVSSIGIDYEINQKTIVKRTYNMFGNLLTETNHINDKLDYQSQYEYNKFQDLISYSKMHVDELGNKVESQIVYDYEYELEL